MVPSVGLPAAENDKLRSALTRAARYGEYFEADTDAGVGSALDIGAAVAAVGCRLGTTEPRVAASALQYEVVERLWSVALGAWAFGRVVPDFGALRLGAGAEGAVVLGFTGLTGWNCIGAEPTAVAEVLAHNVISTTLESFHHELRATVKIADGLLWGNAATALVLAGRSASRARSCAAVTSVLLAQPPLAGRIVGPVSGPVRRRSCCLHYRTSARRTCGDCPLPEAAAVWLRERPPTGERR
jgi:FhuF 2Fe-2S C-terminal domain